MNPSLNELIIKALSQQEEAGFAAGTIANSKKVYNRLLSFAAETGESELSDELTQAFISNSTNSKTGEYCHSRFCLHNQAVARLKKVKETGTVNWSSINHIRHKNELPSGALFQQYLESYLAFLNSTGKRKNTIDSYRNVAAKFLIFSEINGVQQIKNIPQSLIPLFFQELSHSWSATSIRTSAAALRSLLRFFEASESTIRIIPRRCPRKTDITQSLTEPQKEQLWEYLKCADMPTRDKAIVMLMLFAGLRPSDVINLKLEDIKWMNNTICLIQQKTGKPLTLPMAPVIGNAIKDYVCNYRPIVTHRNVFLKSVAPYTPLSDHAACHAIIKNALHQACIDTEGGERGGRLLRRSAATGFLRAGVRMSDISAAMGHSKQETTEIYLSNDEDAMRRCVLPLPRTTKAGCVI
ncbi:MAG: site-specific integrase [Defluviitaleaceae bacterium]|nr:site-specific integrase [Defluviitaleaceae bacterium]